jgi:hypothetical protein
MASLLHLGEGQLLLFGGRSEQGKALQDTWTYNIDRYAHMCEWREPLARRVHVVACMCLPAHVRMYGGCRHQALLMLPKVTPHKNAASAALRME